VAPQSKSGIKTINYTNPNSSVKMYQGEVNSTGKPHGIGKITFSNGSVIETRFSDNGIVFGEKTTLYKNGQTFSGTMEKNKDGRSYFKPSEKDSERYKLTKK
jgi:antitoxin component YwqK of YwqJK toxin-antitoxin module